MLLRAGRGLRPRAPPCGNHTRHEGLESSPRHYVPVAFPPSDHVSEVRRVRAIAPNTRAVSRVFEAIAWSQHGWRNESANRQRGCAACSHPRLWLTFVLDPLALQREHPGDLWPAAAHGGAPPAATGKPPHRGPTSFDPARHPPRQSVPPAMPTFLPSHRPSSLTQFVCR